MQEKKTERAPGGYEDFVAYLGTVRTEEELFSPLTYWFVGQNCPEDVCFRPQLVEARAKELGFWQGLTFKVEHWMTTSRAEAEAAGREAFQSRIGEDYAAYREKAEAARERARRRRLSSPFLYIPKCLDDIPVRDVSWLVEGLLPQAPERASGRPSWWPTSRRERPPASSPSPPDRPAGCSSSPGRTTPPRCSKPA